MTKPIRPRSLARLIETAGAEVWLVDPEGRLAYASPALVESASELETLVEEACPDFLRPADGLLVRGHNTRPVQLPGRPANSAHGAASAHFVTIAASDGRRWVLGVLGPADRFRDDASLPLDQWFGPGGLRDAAVVARLIDQHQRRASQQAAVWLLGQSPAAESLRRRLQLAQSVREHVGLFTPPGGDAVTLATQIVTSGNPAEPLLVLDGSLMDAELLQVYAEPLIGPIRQSTDATGSLIVDRIAELSDDGQTQLLQWIDEWSGRLRLLGVVDRSLDHRSDSSAELTRLSPELTPPRGLGDALRTRVSVLTVEIAALADRGEDLPLLAAAVLRLTRTAPPRLSRDAVDAMITYPWPGNAEELVAAMKHAAAATPGDRISREHLPLAIRTYRVPDAVARRGSVEEPADFRIESLDRAVRAYEASLIERAMKAAGGNKADAARRLGISRTRLLRKLDEPVDAPEVDDAT